MRQSNKVYEVVYSEPLFAGYTQRKVWSVSASSPDDAVLKLACHDPDGVANEVWEVPQQKKLVWSV